MVLLILFLSFLICTAEALDIQVGHHERPHGAVILVVDGLGSSYVYPEHNPYALDGTPLEKATLFNLTGRGARVIDVRVPLPETRRSHQVLITGSLSARTDDLGPTIFDAARDQGYLCLAVLERGDSIEVLLEQDAVLYLDDNSLHGAQPIPGFRDGAPSELRALFSAWGDRFDDYTASRGVEGYASYNLWALDAAADIVSHLSGRRFLMLVDIGAVDSAGHDLGPDGYRKTIQALDEPLGELALACRRAGVLLVVTSDHGMAFPDGDSSGGHSSAKYAGRPESLRVPLVLTGPGVQELNLAGYWSEVDIAPTLLEILEIQSWDGRSMPLKSGYDLTVTGARGELELLRDGLLLAHASGDEEHRFRDLDMGIYTLRSDGRSLEVVVSGDQEIDLAGPAVPSLRTRWAVGTLLILAINLAGVLVILRILREGRS
ncbi:MAG: alkaline phosphatase family protein [Methanothrix sp.]|nr:alkaline phosphatase family protein [Methanothrix sp.]